MATVDALEGRIPESPIRPFALFLYDRDPGWYVLELQRAAVEAAAWIFEKHDLPWNRWDVVIRHAARMRAPDIAGLLDDDQISDQTSEEYDEHGHLEVNVALTAPEEHISALRRLGELLHELYHDHGQLAHLIQDIDPREFFET